MITYKFTPEEATGEIFASKIGDIDYLEVPLRILVPRVPAIELGLDYLQKKIIAALDRVVAELNTLTKGETK